MLLKVGCSFSPILLFALAQTSEQVLTYSSCGALEHIFRHAAYALP